MARGKSPRQGKFFLANLPKSVPPPPSLPTNKPISLGSKTDEEIVELSNYEFALPVKILLANSTSTRRHRSNNPNPPKPQNAFMLYRRDKLAKYKKHNLHDELKQCDISKLIANEWNNEINEVKELFRALARMSENMHLKEHGEGYRCMPKQTSSKKKKKCTKSANSSSLNIGSPASDYSETSNSSSDLSSSDIGSPNSDISFDLSNFVIDSPTPTLDNNDMDINSQPSDNSSISSDLPSFVINSSASDDTTTNFNNNLNVNDESANSSFNTTYASNIPYINASNATLGFSNFDVNGSHNMNNVGFAPSIQLDQHFVRFLVFAYNLYVNLQNSPPNGFNFTTHTNEAASETLTDASGDTGAPTSVFVNPQFNEENCVFLSEFLNDPEGH